MCIGVAVCNQLVDLDCVPRLLAINTFQLGKTSEKRDSKYGFVLISQFVHSWIYLVGTQFVEIKYIHKISEPQIHSFINQISCYCLVLRDIIK